MASEIEVCLKYRDKDVRFPEVRTSFLTELEPLVIGAKVKRYNYAHKATDYNILTIDDVFDHDGYEQEEGVPDVFYDETSYFKGVPGRYVVATLHYFTPTKKLERFRVVRLRVTEKGLERTC
jgi:hypothetical protein